MGYSNFKDPVGLLKRMLVSGNKIAYSVLFREALGKLLIPVDVLLQPMERKKLKATRKKIEHPIILVLGGSRSGTTLLYQTLAHYLSVSYISNFISAFQRSPISAYSLFNGIIPESKEDFQSYFGSVAGLGGPNDAFFLWNRWLGEDRNQILKAISPKSESQMRRFFSAWFNVSKKPFLNKNNRNSLCASMIDKALKNVFFIEIHRDPVFVAQSLVLSRRTVQGSDKIGWGLLSEDVKDTGDPLQYIDNICRQVYRVDRAIERERQKIDSDRYIRISYESFCENPAGIIHEIAHKADIGLTNSENLADLEFSKTSNGQRLEDHEFDRIRSTIKKLYEKKNEE